MEHAFPCGTLALDFVGTLRARRNALPREMLGAPSSLDAWFRESGLADEVTPATAADLERAVDLREAIYTLVAARLFGKPADQAAVVLLNEVAATPPVIPRLTPSGRHVAATAAQALSSVARQAVDVLGGREADLLKECGRPECTQVYLDHSRGFRREWCAMRTCGSRMKAAAYRSRKREAAG
jgi:predicted RNA-binding Zn ribbon-like protein